MVQPKFVRLVSCFTSPEERNLDYLANVYDDNDKLSRIVNNLFGDEFLASIASKRVLLKPNWVKHSYNEGDDLCLRTNSNLLLVILEVVLKQNPQSVIIGDAPIQGCRWTDVVDSTLEKNIQNLSEIYKIPVVIKDFRRRVFSPGANKVVVERNHLSEYIIFDVAEKSFLEPISTKGGNFRVTDYDYERLAITHKLGTHKYCITKQIVDSDVVISIPKIKTHQKTGMTGALKNIVGLNGDKDFLPHHRVGGDKNEGDCYPGFNLLRKCSEWTLDRANKHQGTKSYVALRRISSLLWMLSFPKPVHNLGAAWHGNDTCWRMVMDLNKIIIFGKKDGTLSNEPQRQLFSFCDAIIGGQGDGPLFPYPLPLGMLSFTNDSALNDICMTQFMGFDADKITLIKVAKEMSDFSTATVSLNGILLEDIDELSKYSIKTEAAPGWIDFLNQPK